MKIQSQNYITIQGFMRTELNLTGNDLLVYAIIYGVCQDGESKFTGSLQYLADWCGATKHGIMKNLKNLLDRHLIIKEDTVINGVKFVTYHVTELHTMELSYINNISSISLDNIDTGSINNNQQVLLTDNTNNTNNTNNINKEELEVRIKEDCEWFVATYHEVCQSLPKCKCLTDKRKKAIRNILKKFTKEEILEVFNNLENSDFCKGKNDRGWKADIDFILREDKFVSVLEGKYNSKRKCNVEEISEGVKFRVTAEEKEEMRKAVERGELKEY